MINLEVFRRTLKEKFSSNSSKSVEVNASSTNQQGGIFGSRKVDTSLVEVLRAAVKAAADEKTRQIICGLGIFQASKKETSEGAAVVEVVENNVQYVKALEVFGKLDLNESTAGNVTRFIIPSESLKEVTARVMAEFITPPNCYDSEGIIFTGKKNYRYRDIFKLTCLPVEVKTAPADCGRCTYSKARGTIKDTCAKCKEISGYYDWCHCRITADAGQFLNAYNLARLVDTLKIGYDVTTREVIIPLNGWQFVSIGLTYGDYNHGWGFADKVSASRILYHFNLEGVDDTLPYLDNRFFTLDGARIYAKCIGNASNVNLPFVGDDSLAGAR